ncbi:MAG: hypothetical protein DRI77_12985, partial [Chloroflexi bacterium]
MVKGGAFTGDDLEFIAKQYHTLIRRVVEPYESALNVIVNLASFACKERPRAVLNIGVGSGELAAKLLKRFPEAAITGIDPVEEFVKVARQRFILESGKVEISVGDPLSMNFSSPFDLVVAMLSLHRLSAEERGTALRKIYDALSAGGLFINCDFCPPDDADAQNLYKRMWFKYLELNNLNPRRR